jgi:hypothetical protein
VARVQPRSAPARGPLGNTGNAPYSK